MTTGQVIRSSEYDDIYQKVKTIFESGSGDSGYGQILSAPPATIGDTITYSMWTKLRNDLLKIKMHQRGILIGSLPINDKKNLIIPSTDMSITDAFHTQYLDFVNQLVTDKFLIHGSQAQAEILIDTTRQTNWNGTIVQNITISGSSKGDGEADNLRYFFNAGGSLKLVASRKGVSSPKNDSWTDLLFKIGTITLKSHSTTNDGNIGSGSSVGFYELTTSEQSLFLAYAPQSSYARNYYKITGSINTDRTKISLNIYFADLVSANDQNVSGELRTTLSQNRPTGSYVNVLPFTAAHKGLDASIPSVFYAISANPLKIVENGSVTFTINTNDVPTNQEPNKTLYWKTVGTASSSDFSDGIMNGVITINSLGSATIVRNIVKDDISEPQKYFSIMLMKGDQNGEVVQLSSTVYISDELTYAISAEQIEINEGGSVTFNVTSNVLSGTVLYWDTDVSGGVSINDFTDFKLSGTVSIVNGVGKIVRPIRADQSTERLKKFRINIYADSLGNTKLDDSQDVTIYDTSLSPAVYTITPNSQSVNEGDTVIFSITGGRGNDILYWTTTGTAKVADFYDGSTSGLITLDSTGKYTLNRKITADSLIESSEYFSIQLRSGSMSGEIVAMSPSVEIKDSTAIMAQIEPNVVSVTEGDKVLFNVWSNVPTGTILYWDTESDGTPAATSFDFTDNVDSGTVTINDKGMGIIMRPIKADLLTDGAKNFRLNLRQTSHQGALLKSSSYVTILDTSNTNYSYSITPSVFTMTEGSTVTMNVTSNDLTPNKTLYWTIFGNTPSSDFKDGKISGTVTLNNGTGSFNIITLADTELEGTRKFAVQLRKDNLVGDILNVSANVTISDTTTAAIAPDVITVNEGGTVNFNVTSNLAAGTKLYWSTVPDLGSHIDLNDFTDGTASGMVVVDASGSAIIPRTIKSDMLTEGPEKFKLQVSLVSHDNPYIGICKEFVTVLDGSATPPLYRINAPTEVREGNNLNIKVSSDTDKTGTTQLYWEIFHFTTTNADFDHISGVLTLPTYGVSEVTIPTIKNGDKTNESFCVVLYTDSKKGTELHRTDAITLLPTIQYTIKSYLNNVETQVFNVGDVITIKIESTPLDDTRATYYWSADGDLVLGDISNSLTPDFTFTNGIYSMSGSITTAVTSAKTFTISMHSDSITGPVLKTSYPITINQAQYSLIAYNHQSGAQSNSYNSGELFDMKFSSPIHTAPTLTWKRTFVTSGSELQGTLENGTFTLGNDGLITIPTDGYNFIPNAAKTNEQLYYQIMDGNTILAKSDTITINRVIATAYTYEIKTLDSSNNPKSSFNDGEEFKIQVGTSDDRQTPAVVKLLYSGTALDTTTFTPINLILSNTTPSVNTTKLKFKTTSAVSSEKVQFTLNDNAGNSLKTCDITINKQTAYKVVATPSSINAGSKTTVTVNMPGLSDVDVAVFFDRATITYITAPTPAKVHLNSVGYVAFDVQTNSAANTGKFRVGIEAPDRNSYYSNDVTVTAATTPTIPTTPGTTPSGPSTSGWTMIVDGASTSTSVILGEDLPIKFTTLKVNAGMVMSYTITCTDNNTVVKKGTAKLVVVNPTWDFSAVATAVFSTNDVRSLPGDIINLSISATSDYDNNVAEIPVKVHRASLAVYDKESGGTVLTTVRPSVPPEVWLKFQIAGDFKTPKELYLRASTAGIKNVKPLSPIGGWSYYSEKMSTVGIPTGAYTAEIGILNSGGAQGPVVATTTLTVGAGAKPDPIKYTDIYKPFNFTVPAGITKINLELVGGGGGGGGADFVDSGHTAGYNGSPGAFVRLSSIPVTPGEILTMVAGGGGNGGIGYGAAGPGKESGNAPGGSGGWNGLGPQGFGGNGGNSGPNNFSGSGGGGGAASCIWRSGPTGNFEIIAAAGGGGGGGGAGQSNGQPSRGGMFAPFTGGNGTSHPSDGGGGGGGGSGYPNGGAGGGVANGDNGGYSGASGDSFPSSSGDAGNGGTGSTRRDTAGSAGGSGYVQITFD